MTISLVCGGSQGAFYSTECPTKKIKGGMNICSRFLRLVRAVFFVKNFDQRLLKETTGSYDLITKMILQSS